jgi:hypothetical protein
VRSPNLKAPVRGTGCWIPVRSLLPAVHPQNDGPFFLAKVESTGRGLGGHTHTRRDLSRGASLTSRPKPNLALEHGSSQHHSMANSPSPTDKSFRDTIARRIR